MLALLDNLVLRMQASLNGTSGRVTVMRVTLLMAGLVSAHQCQTDAYMHICIQTYLPAHAGSEAWTKDWLGHSACTAGTACLLSVMI